jgi:hypothetical protein
MRSPTRRENDVWELRIARSKERKKGVFVFMKVPSNGMHGGTVLFVEALLTGLSLLSIFVFWRGILMMKVQG